MEFTDYQTQTRAGADYPGIGNNFIFPTLGLTGEAGEIADKIKKLLRDDDISTPAHLSAEHVAALAKEIGDVLWYMSQLCSELGLSLDEVAAQNLKKVASRHERGKVSGSGDER